MTDLDKEHVLQKIVAVTGFVFALLILPVAQYFLVNNQAAQPGTVAGVSTDTSITKGDVPAATDPAACVAQQQKDLQDLQQFSDGKMIALQRAYDTVVNPYQTALGLDPTADGKAALNKLIADETVTFTSQKAAVQTAVDAQAKSISGRNCGTVAATPVASP